MTARPSCLWIMRERPFPPNYGGEWTYSARLLAAMAVAGADLTVLCTARGGAPPADFPANVEWSAVGSGPASVSPSVLLSPLPAIAARHATSPMRSRLRELLAARRWDAVVIDGIGAGWALDTVVGAIGRRVIYVSENDETAVRRAAALSYAGPAWKRAVVRWDASKVAPLERRLLAAATTVFAISPEDADSFARFVDAGRIRVLRPGYDGPRPALADPATLPRRGVILGSFNWIAKQANLLGFLKAAANDYVRAGAELLVVGDMPADFRARLARDYPAVTFTGPVADIGPYLLGARIGLIPEQAGGGFKLKALDYVFHGLPIAALDGSYAGMPLIPDESVLSYPDMRSLARGSLEALDAPDRLRSLRDAALRACDGQFDWGARGRMLADAVRRLGGLGEADGRRASGPARAVL